MKTRTIQGRNGLALVTAIGVAGFAGLALVVAPRVVGGAAGTGAERVVTQVDFPLAPGMVLQILNTSGRIAVSECEGDEARLTITCESTPRGSAVGRMLLRWSAGPAMHAAAVEPSVRKYDRGVQVSTLGIAPADGEAVSYHFDVKLPRGRNLDVSNGNGTICVAGIEGDLAARSDNGDVRCEDVMGNVSARVRNGGVFCRYISGAIDVSTANGAIELDAIPAQHYPVRAFTSNGAIKFRAPDMALRLRATTENGRVVSETSAVGADQQQTLHVLDMNGGSETAEVELHALNGNIYVDAS